MPAVVRYADLFICKCYFHTKEVRFYMNYQTITEHWEEFGAKRIILTHMGPEMPA